MTLEAPSCRLRLLPVVAAATILHLLVLCTPIVLADDIRRIGNDPRLAIFLFLAGAWCFLEGITSPVGKRPPLRTAGPRWLAPGVALAVLLTFWVSLVDSALRTPAPFGTGAVAGAVLMGTGVALRCLSIQTLGRYFLNEVALMPGQPLVTHGVYGSLRHPSEAGTLCLGFGGAMVLGSLAGLVTCTLLLLPCVIWRARLEDAVLCQHHPAAFRRYSREVPAFVPTLRLRRRRS